MQKFIAELDELKNNHRYRTIKNIKNKFSKYIIVDDKKMLNLSSNDYLNLSTDKDIILEFTEKHKQNPEFLFSSASARLLTGNSSAYFDLENKIASLFKKEKALLFNTGYQCNQGVISSLAHKGDCIISDKLNHASIVSGLKLSPAEHFRYKHCDYDNLENILKTKRAKYKNAFIISESVFSMDGDIADIKKLIELKKKYDCMLMIDEAHAFGVFGDSLAGVASQLNLSDDIDIITITLGKAMASQGAACISSSYIINYLINKAASFIFSTALPSVNILWTNFLLNEKIDLLIQKKEKLNDLFKYVHQIYPSSSASQIIPVVIGDAHRTQEKAQELQNKGYYVLAINPPTVPEGTSRLRLSLCADMEKAEITELFKLVKNEI